MSTCRGTLQVMLGGRLADNYGALCTTPRGGRGAVQSIWEYAEEAGAVVGRIYGKAFTESCPMCSMGNCKLLVYIRDEWCRSICSCQARVVCRFDQYLALA